MTKAKISEYDAVAANNTDVNGVNIAEGCPPSSMNNMGREIMAALKRFETGADGDSLTVGGSLVVSGTATTNTLIAGPVSATTLNTSGAVVFNDAGADVDFRVEGDTDANLLFVDAGNDRVGVGTNTPGAKIEATASGAVVQILNRTTSDGDVLQLEKDGTTVGSIGTPFTGELYIEASGANSSGLLFTSGNSVQPRKNSAADDGNISIGTSGNRFKDLYLSGSVYLGGTTSANALDDYEEGTWTPTITGRSTNPTIGYGAPRTGVYTKIGRVVYWNVSMQINSSSGGSGDLLVSLPMAVANGNQYWGWTAIYTSGMDWGPNNTCLVIRMENNASTFNIYGFANNSGNNTSASVSLPQTNLSQIYASGFYTAA